ncbi:MAG TPA: hypothetical protein VFT31_01475 [Kribbella sp.]|nr:hypothetical protein [Kribbella sp.]
MTSATGGPPGRHLGRTQTASKLRSLLREYYPAFLATFEDLTSREARATLHLAPSPADSSRLRKNSLTAALRRAGRRCGIESATDRIIAGLKTQQLRQPLVIEAAMAAQARAFARTLDTMAGNITNLDNALATAYQSHPDSTIISSFPGLGRS